MDYPSNPFNKMYYLFFKFALHNYFVNKMVQKVITFKIPFLIKPNAYFLSKPNTYFFLKPNAYISEIK